MPFTQNPTNEKRQGPSDMAGSEPPAKRRPGRPRKAPQNLTQEHPPTNTQQGLANISQEESPQDDQQTEDDDVEIPLAEINFKNYKEAKKAWPLYRIKAQVLKQQVKNQKIPPLVLKEAQTLFKELDHSLQFLAMMSGCNVDSLKQKMCVNSTIIYWPLTYVSIILSSGLVSATHSENKWHRWLSFSVEANSLPSKHSNLRVPFSKNCKLTKDWTFL